MSHAYGEVSLSVINYISNKDLILYVIDKRFTFNLILIHLIIISNFVEVALLHNSDVFRTFSRTKYHKVIWKFNNNNSK